MAVTVLPVVAYNFTSFYDDYEIHNISNTTVDVAQCSVSAFVQPVLTQFLWSLIFGGLIIIAAGGNIIVIWIVLAHRRMRTVTNYFLLNLAFADALIAILNIPFNFSFLLNNIWYFGFVYCKIAKFTGTLMVTASIFTLSAIAVDRYIAIVHPMKPRMSKTKAKSIIFLVWVLSGVICFPNLVYAQLIYIPCFDGVRIVCILDFPDGIYNEYDFWYNISCMVITYFLPLAAMGVSYGIVGVKLWGSHAPGESSSRHKEQLKAKRKVVKMMVIVVLLFGICWIPVHIYFLLGRHHSYLYKYEHIQEIFLFLYWVAMSNSMYNPLIYCWMNDKFRKGFKKALRFLPGVHWKPEDSIDAPRPSTLSSCHSMKLSRNGSVMTTVEESLAENAF
ncbi:neuromedin-K receptor-like [Saccoglossus kowalevskii]|uniref:Neuromedin-K receptor-like n=1 Tax=Saccoglossus kowalevskii TaxID=10224 RepID=A0ABM0GLE4_SACKO|nr:PREDICTED: neuromedin-K receptor-like [Saccoglossus kowalevskii]